MPKLTKLNDIQDVSELDGILGSDISVYEDIQGSKIYVNWNGKSFTIKPKSLSSDPINLIDLAMQNYYNHAINFFNSLDGRVKSLLNPKWWFCFEFFPDNQPANIAYNRIPKNHLVLTSISKNGKFDFTFDELEEYSRLFGVDVLPVIFRGKLTEKTIEAIKYFLNTSESDLEYVFGEKSFAYFFYRILNPQTQHSFLMDEDFQKNLEKLIIKVDGVDASFEILNPLYRRISDANSTDFVEIYSLILVNFLNFCQSVDMDQIKIKGSKREDCYIYTICKLFNMYLSEVKEDILKFDFTVPEFYDRDKFRVNTELIPNKLTKQYISEDRKIEYIFKCILGSFNKPRKKPIGVFNEATIKIFNLFVKEIQDRIDRFFKKKSEVELTRSGLMNFGDYFDIKFDIDGDDQVYIPDVYREMEKGEEKSKKKGDKGKFEIETKFPGEK
jgi:hypothetical protein